MTFLPIVQRELRQASRRRLTYRLRWWSATFAITVGFFSLLFHFASPARTTVGSTLFALLTGYSFVLALFAGIFLTADSLTQEKREGTLGLLFLTDLKGYDVVFGKFFAQSINAFFCLFALLPVTALPVMMGGITGGDVWRNCLILTNVLFFSLSAGMVSSALSRESRGALARTLLLLVAFLLLASVPELASSFKLPKMIGRLGYLSPLYPLLTGRASLYAAAPEQFWSSLLASHMTAWLFLGTAAFALPSAWQEKEERKWISRGPLSRPLFTGRPGRSRPLLDSENPVTWLVSRTGAQSRLQWAVVLAWGAFVALSFGQWIGEITWMYPFAKGCGFILKLLFAVAACRFFIEARQSGALELLLCTPLRNGEIVKGQWVALRRAFLWPALVLLSACLLPVCWQLSSVLTGKDPLGHFGGFGLGIVSLAWFCFGFLADMLAVGWFGMWLALRMKKPALAPAATILFVLILPSIGFCGLDIVADACFISAGAAKLHGELRWLAMRQWNKAAG